MVRYALADQGQVSYGVEATPYTKEAAAKYFGLLSEDIEFPGGQNPQTRLKARGTKRGPYIHSPDIKEYGWPMPIIPIDHNIPLEIAIGERLITSETGYDKHLFKESDILQTATIEHVQKDLDFAEWFIGSKASISSMKAAVGDPVSIDMDITSAKHEFDDTGGHTPPILGLPKKTPFMFWMVCGVEYGAKEIATINSFDVSIDNGLTPRHHGCNREAYTIVEDTSADKYEVTLGIDIVDTDLFKEAAEDGALKNLTIPIPRRVDTGVMVDGMIIRLEDCKIPEANIPSPAQGPVETDITVLPLGIEIEIRTPTT